MDYLMHPVVFFGGLIVIIVGLLFVVESAGRREMAEFQTSCIASGFTQAQCDVLAATKRDARNARNAAAFAVGFAAGSR